jgi:G3E family GTPase
MTTPIPLPISNDDFGAGKTTILDHRLATAPVSVDGRLKRAGVEPWLAGVMPAADGRLTRVSGILALSGEPRRCVVPGAGDQLTLELDNDRRAPRRSRLVFIGHHLDSDALQAGLEASQTRPVPDTAQGQRTAAGDQRPPGASPRPAPRTVTRPGGHRTR